MRSLLLALILGSLAVAACSRQKQGEAIPAPTTAQSASTAPMPKPVAATTSAPTAAAVSTISSVAGSLDPDLSDAAAVEAEARSTMPSPLPDFKVVVDEQNIGDCKSEGGCLNLRIVYPEFAGDSPAAQAVNATILNLRPRPMASEEVSFDKAVTDLIATTKEAISLGEIGPNGWEYEGVIEVAMNAGGIITLRVGSYEYFGGAHPNHSGGYVSLDAQTGERIPLSAILNGDQTERLRPWAEEGIRKHLELGSGAPLSEAGIDFGDNGFYINAETFGIFEDHLQFVYDTYEIGPYPVGSIEFSVPYSEIVDVLQANYPLFAG